MFIRWKNEIIDMNEVCRVTLNHKFIVFHWKNNDLSDTSIAFESIERAESVFNCLWSDIIEKEVYENTPKVYTPDDGVRMAPQKKKEPEFDPILFRPIAELLLTTRSYNCLTTLSIGNIGDLVQYSETDLHCLPTLGAKSVEEIKKRLSLHSLSLGTKLENWPFIMLDPLL